LDIPSKYTSGRVKILSKKMIGGATVDFDYFYFTVTSLNDLLLCCCFFFLKIRYFQKMQREPLNDMAILQFRLQIILLCKI